VTLGDVDLDAIAALESDGPALMAALARLPTRQRDAIHARILEERPYDEIADQLQCSELVVRKTVSRGLRALRNTVEQQP
jgi:RNA polymerase sigma-70 factor (ECF subfamily)